MDRRRIGITILPGVKDLKIKEPTEYEDSYFS